MAFKGCGRYNGRIGGKRQLLPPILAATHQSRRDWQVMAAHDSTSAPVVCYKTLPEFPTYMVGDDGTVWEMVDDVWRRVEPRSGTDGYQYVCLKCGIRKRQTSVHRIILETFVGPCPPRMLCCHAPDTNPTNNRLSNLRWDTHLANSRDRKKHGRNPLRPLPKRCFAVRKKSPPDRDAIDRQWLHGFSVGKIADANGLSVKTVRKILKETAAARYDLPDPSPLVNTEE